MLTTIQMVNLLGWLVIGGLTAVLFRKVGTSERLLLVIPLLLMTYTVIFYILLILGIVETNSQLGSHISSVGRMLEVLLFATALLLRLRERVGTE